MEKTPKIPGSTRFSFARFLPLLLLVAGLVAFFASGLSSYLTLDALKENRDTLRSFVQAHKAEAVGVFILAYIAVAALSLPVGVVLSVAGGFLFGSLFGAAWIVIGATIGATILFVVAKSALGEPLRQRFAAQVKTMEDGFKANAFSYLLLLRLVPLFPFWLVNLAPAFLGVSITIFVATTFIGIIPGAFVFASIGNGLNALFDAGEQPDLSLVGLLARPDFYIPIAGLAVLSLIPIVYRAVSAKRASNG